MPAGVPFVFVNGTEIIDANQVNANFAAIVAYINGLMIPTTPVSIPNGGTGATTVQGALTALGLGAGILISSTVAVGSGSPLPLTVTPAATEPLVTALSDGVALLFQMPASPETGPFNIVYQASAGPLTGVELWDAPGLNVVSTLAASQVVIAVYSAPAGKFLMVNTPTPAVSTAPRFAQYTSSGSFVWPTGFTEIFFSGTGGGGGGGAGQAANAGGGGGGAGQAYLNAPITGVPGSTYTIIINSGGAGGVGAAGSTGGSVQILRPDSSVLISCAGGAGGGFGNTTSPSVGGAPGGAGGMAGSGGTYAVAAGISFPGWGGGGLLGTGGAGGIAGIGQIPGQFGGGGGGGNANSGGAGAPPYILLKW